MDYQLKDKVIMVAAASQGIGFGIADAVAREGARLSIASRSRPKIEHAAGHLRDTYEVDCSAYVMDASDAESISQWCRATIDEFGRIDGLVINAGGPAPGKFDDFEDADWDQAYQLTLMSAVRMVRGVLPMMRNQGSGSIVTVSSSSVKEPIQNLLLSNVFRTGVTSLVKSLSVELAQQGIRINNLVPGRIDTERVQNLDKLNAAKAGITAEQEAQRQAGLIPLGCYGSIADMGNAGAFLLSEASAYITGTTLVVDGGNMKSIQ